MKYLSILVVCILMVGSSYATYKSGSWDEEVMEKVDARLEKLSDVGGKEHLVALFSRVITVAEDVDDVQTLYLLEYILQVIAAHLEDGFDVKVGRDPLRDEDMEVEIEEKEGGDDEDNEEDGDDTVKIITSVVSGDPAIVYTLEDFYATYKGWVTSTAPISDLCTMYYDKIDAVAKEYDFPTALIVATWYREHTCIFDNPTNGRGNFQITSHYYPVGEMTWEKFENQVINFIVFSRAKWDYYDDVQTYGEDPIALTYDSIDLTSLRKHAIFYNGINGELDTNPYANQNFGRVADGRDGIVAMTIRALGWQLHEDTTEKLQTEEIGGNEEEIEDEEDEEEIIDVEDEEQEGQEDGESEEDIDEDCDEQFTVNLGPDATNPAVLDMQEFLADQGFYVGDPSGIYDEKTTEAVNAFQAYYKEEILDPGGYVAPTGYWYPATRRKANALVCE